MTGICYYAYYVPHSAVCLETYLKENPDITLPTGYDSLNDYRKQISQFRSIAVWGEESPIEEVSKLVEGFFSKTHVHPNEVSYLIHTEDVYWNNRADAAHYIHRKYGMSNASICPMFRACSGTLLALEISQSLLAQTGDSYIIILCCQSVSEFKNRFSRRNVYGDGAGIMVVGRNPSEYEIVDSTFQTSGQGSFETIEGIETGQGYLRALSDSAKNLKQMLSRNGLRSSDIHAIVPQNISRGFVETVLEDACGFRSDKIFFSNSSVGGHMSNVDIIRNLKDYTMNSVIPKGSYVLLFAIRMSIVGPNARDSDFRYMLLRYAK